jgi:hypothetical protein
MNHSTPLSLPNVIWLGKFSTLFMGVFQMFQRHVFDHPTDLVVFAHVGRMWKKISMHNLKRQSVDLNCLL